MNEIIEYYNILKQYRKVKDQRNNILKNITDKYLNKMLSIIRFVNYGELIEEDKIYGNDEIIGISKRKNILIFHIRYGVRGCIDEYDIIMPQDIFNNIVEIYNSLFELKPEELEKTEWYNRLKKIEDKDDIFD